MNFKELTFNKLDKTDIKLFYILLGTVFVYTALETLGIGSFMPFLTVLSNPEEIQNNKIISFLHESLGGGDQMQFAVKVGISICAIMLVRTGVLYFLTWFKVKFSNLVFRKLSVRLLEVYLSLPYSYFLMNNTAAMLKNITKEITCIRTTLLIVIDLITNTTLLLAIISFLFYIDKYLVFFAGLYSIFVILVISKLTKSKILKEGKLAEFNYRNVFKSGKQSLDGVKEIKQTQSGDHFIGKYDFSMKGYTENNVNIQMLKQGPVICLELFTYLAFFGVVFYLTKSKEGFVNAVPTLGMLAMAVKRVIPALNNINGGLAKLRSLRPPLEILNEVFNEGEKSIHLGKDPNFKFKESISFENISFSYEGSQKKALKDITFTIKKGMKVGIVGGSGSGKTTLVDILLGLLENYEGKIKVDSNEISIKNHGSLQELIGYIPQQIYLLDDTVEKNVAFGVEESDINSELIKDCAKTAQIDALIETLPLKYQNILGDRGLKLSGGERQRIGIARAIYRNPEILILDEATSALDNIVEAKFQKAIDKYAQNKTLLVIAHRLTTVKDCDVIYIFNEGKLEAFGSFEELSKDSEYFQKLLNPNQDEVSAERV